MQTHFEISEEQVNDELHAEPWSFTERVDERVNIASGDEETW